MLIPFRSKAAGEFLMIEGHVQAIFALMGKPYTQEGVFAATDLSAYILKLNTALAQAQANEAMVSNAESSSSDLVRVGLKQRAWPLIDMLERADKKRVDVVWGNTV